MDGSLTTQLAAMILAGIQQHDASGDFVVTYEPLMPRSQYVIFRHLAGGKLHVRVSVVPQKLTAEQMIEIARHLRDVRDGTYVNFHSFESQKGETVWQATLGPKGLSSNSPEVK